MIYLDLFSGIGGFIKGFVEAGFKIDTHYYSEIDQHAIANYKYNFKDSIYVGSVVDLVGTTISRPNIISFGSPCQDFSLAGKRAGMEGSRSSLINQAIRLITECRPDVFIWENVKGAFSSNDGSDFWGIIQAFTNIRGYRLEWQLLNTSWFLPQNRERIYLVGHLDGRSVPGIFPFGEYREQYNEIKQPDETTNIRTLSAGGHSGGRHSSMTLLKMNLKEGFRSNDYNVEDTLQSRDYKGYCNQDMDFILSHSPRSGNPNKGGTGPSLSNIHSFTVDSSPHLVNGVRRLTEIECERLQGFPDDWTLFGDYKGVVKRISRSQRYKLIGNAVSVPCTKNIASRIKLKTP